MNIDGDFIFSVVLVVVMVFQMLKIFTLQREIELIGNAYAGLVLKLTENGTLNDPKYKKLLRLYNEQVKNDK